MPTAKTKGATRGPDNCEDQGTTFNMPAEENDECSVSAEESAEQW
jgi:hypothetical protein